MQCLRGVQAAGFVVVAGLGAGSLWAQQSTTRQQPPIFTSAVDVVSVDATVIDANGQPVRNLTAHDFMVKVDGQPRTIVSAQFVALAGSDSKAAQPEVSPSDYTSNVPGGPPGRLIAIVVDRGSIAPVRAKDVFAAAARFVEGLEPQDRVAVFSIPEGPNFDFTTDHELIAAALLRTDGAQHPTPGIKDVGLAEALEMQRGNTLTTQTVNERECGANIQDVRDASGNSEVAMCVRLVQDEAATIATEAQQRTRDTMSGLATLLGRLGTSETPKMIVLVSEGLVLEGERFLTSTLEPLLAATHATIFAIKPEPSDSDASQARVPQSRVRDRTVNETGLTMVTQLSGGEMFRVLANPDFSFKRLAAELSGYYLIGFEPAPHDRDGKQHKIAVAVQRKDVQIRAREEFSVQPVNAANSAQAVDDLLRSPAFATTVPFKLTTYVFEDTDPGKVRLLVGIETDRTQARELAMGLLLINANGQPASAFLQPSIDTHPTRGGPGTYFATMAVEPGTYMLKAALVDGSGHRGSLERPVRAYLTRIGPFRATQLLIGDGKGEAAGAGSIAPTVSGDLAGDTLYAYLDLIADAPAAYATASARIDIIPDGGSRAAVSTAAVLQPSGPDPRDRAAAGSVAIRELSAGSYVARAVVLVDGHPVGEMDRPFRIVRNGGR